MEGKRITKKEKLEQAIQDGFKECLRSQVVQPLNPEGYAIAMNQFASGMLLCLTILETIDGEGAEEMRQDLGSLITEKMSNSREVIRKFIASLDNSKATLLPKSQKN